MPKNKPNAFMSFVMEWKNKGGRQNMSVPQAIKEAGPIWQNMSTKERTQYTNRAKHEIGNLKQPEMLDCLGRSLSQVQKERDDIEKNLRNMKRFIENTIKQCVKTGALESQKFCFVMVNYFLKTREGVHVPAELAIAQFSLKDGVHRRYHILINPDVDIFGYQYEAQVHSNETHTLPLPPKALGEKDWGLIYNQFINFIRDPVTQEIPPVYTHREHMAAVKSVLGFLHADSESCHETVEVYSIQHLFFVMKNYCAEIGEVEKPSSIFVTDAYFERDFFEYQFGIACEFHEEKDRSKYCALSCVVRWGYMFGDYMCSDIAIIPKPGFHIPKHVKLNGITIAPELGKQAIVKSEVKTDRSKDSFWDSRWNNEEPENRTFYQDFPALGARKKTTASSVSSYAPSGSISCKREKLPISDDYDYVLESNNPWSRSQRNKPQEPDNSIYSINYSSSRTNQTLLADDDTSVASSWGRGASARKPTLGHGRGKLFQ